MDSVLFLGDIASPDEKCSLDLLKSLKKHPGVFTGKQTIANLEGLLADGDMNTSTPVLFNHASVIEPLKALNTNAVSLANNHTLDLPDNLQITTKLLTNNNIGYFGAGVDVADAEKPAAFMVNGKKLMVFGYCWHIMMQHQKNKPGKLFVNTIQPLRILASIKKVRKENPESLIVLKMHWNFDLETLPFPLYRELSRDLIDAGANAVIGSHSHCIQGGERYKDGFIIYGLGNFFIPWYTYINNTIRFLEFARKELALEWNPSTNQITCHWFNYRLHEKDHQLIYEGSEDFDVSATMAEYSPYANMSHIDYIKYFKKHRRKRLLLPIYKSYHNKYKNLMIDYYLIYRIRFARLLSRLKIRDWNN